MASPKASAQVADRKATPPAKAGKSDHVVNAHYQVALVEKTESPDGANGSSWYRYVIEGGYGPLTGCRAGTQRQITDYAKQLAEELNVRSGLGTPSPWAPRQKK